MAHRRSSLVRRLALTLVGATLALAAFASSPTTAFGGSREPPRVGEGGKTGTEGGKTAAQREKEKAQTQKSLAPATKHVPTADENVKQAAAAERAAQAAQQNQKSLLRTSDLRLSPARPALTQPEVAAVDALSRLVARTDTLELVLSHHVLANNPWSAVPEWHQLSPRDQVTTLVRSAISVSHQNAEKTLAAMTQALAQQYATVKRDPALRRYLKVTALPPPVELPKLSEPQLQAQELDPRHAHAVDALSHYLGITSVSAKDLAVAAGLSTDRALEIQVVHAGDPRAAISAIASASKLPQSGIARMVAYMAARYETAKQEPALRPFLSN